MLQKNETQQTSATKLQIEKDGVVNDSKSKHNR
jgi:hypothetical protein